MIEINLVPDVKQELINAQRTRSMVIAATILVGIAAVVIVVLLSAWVVGVQTLRGKLIENTIKSESAKLAAVEDLDSSLTIQQQLEVLPALHQTKQVDSRIFDVLTTISPAAPNNVTISKLSINAPEKSITVEAQATGGYPALEVFKKTIMATEFRFIGKDNVAESRPLATSISDGERSYGENVDGQKVLRFGLKFQYPEELFAPYIQEAKVVGPGTANVTDSYLGIPKSLFSPKAKDSGEED